MPITPRFSITQDGDSITVHINTPYVRVSTHTHVHIEGPEFHFYSKPYLLKLAFPGELVDDERVKAVYDPDKDHGTVSVTAPKLVCGCVWERLDLITTLMQPMRSRFEHGGETSIDGNIGLIEADGPPARSGAAASRNAGAKGTGGVCGGDGNGRLSGEEGRHAAADGPQGQAGSSVDYDLSHVRADADADEADDPDFAPRGAQDATLESLTRSFADLSHSDAPHEAHARPQYLDRFSSAAGPGRRKPLIEVIDSADSTGEAAGGESGRANDDGISQDVRAAVSFEPAALAVAPVTDAATATAARCDAAAAAETRLCSDATSRSIEGVSTRAAGGLLEPGGPEPDIAVTTARPRYGFNRGFSEFFKDLREDFPDLVELPEPDAIPAQHRPTLRHAAEAESFDADRFVADLHAGHEDPIYAEAVSHVPYWMVASLPGAASTGTGTASGGAWSWTEKEVEDLASLRNREYIVDDVLVGPSTLRASVSASSSGATLPSPTDEYWMTKPETLRAVLSIASVLFGHAYDIRTTGGDSTVESAWTASQLSCTLRWLDDEFLPENLDDEASLLHSPASTSISPSQRVHALAAACVRRSLTFPYLRRWDLSILCLQDVVGMLLQGARMVLRALLHVRRLLAREETRYLLNTLLLDDFCVWTQYTPDAVFASLGMMLSKEVLALRPDDALLADMRIAELIQGAHEEPSEADEDDESDETDPSDDDEQGQ